MKPHLFEWMRKNNIDHWMEDAGRVHRVSFLLVFPKELKIPDPSGFARVGFDMPFLFGRNPRLFEVRARDKCLSSACQKLADLLLIQGPDLCT